MNILRFPSVSKFKTALIAILTAALVGASLIAVAPAQAALDVSGSGTINCSGGGYATVASNFITRNDGCAGSIDIPEEIKGINSDAFFGASNLTGITFASSSTQLTIGSYAFYGTNLKSIVIPSRVSSIGPGAFEGNISLTSVTFAGDAPSVGDFAFNAVGAYATATISEHAVFDISTSPAATGEDWNGLIIVRAPDVACSNGGYVDITANHVSSVYFCKGEVELPTGVSEIGDDKFRNQSELTKITLPATLTTIGARAFEDATNLARFIFLGDAPTVVDVSSFIRVPSFATAAISTTATGFSLNRTGARWNVLWVVKAPDLTCTKGGWVTINSLTQTILDGGVCKGSVVIPDGITSIGDPAGNAAFAANTGLVEISFPASLTSIGISSFDGATGLTTVTFRDSANSELTNIGANAFRFATSLTSIFIPKGVAQLASSTFQFDTALTSITFGEGSLLTAIGEGALGTTGLTSIEMPATVTYIGNYAFTGSAELAEVRFLSVTAPSVGTTPFIGVKRGAIATVPEGATTFGLVGSTWNGLVVRKFGFNTVACSDGGYFRINITSIEAPYIEDSIDCKGTVTVPADVASIEESAFENAQDVTSVVFESESALQSIGARAFFGTKITTFDIPKNVLDFGDRAFGDCLYLTSFNVDPANENYSSPGGVLFHQDQLVSYPAAKENNTYQVPANVDNIRHYAFSGSTELEALTFAVGSAYTTVESNDFADIPNLTQLVLPSSVTKIEGLAFSGSSSIETLTIPSGVIQISTNSFDQMQSLGKLGFLGNAPTYGTSYVGLGGNETDPLTFQSDYEPQLFIASTATGFGGSGSWKGLTLFTVDFLYCSDSGYAVVYLNALVDSQYCTGEVTVPKTVIEILPSAFQNSFYLTSVVFEPTSSLTKIGASAFDAALSLSSITIPASVTEIGLTAFGSCRSLTAITVEPGNNHYSSLDGVLFDKSQTKLITYPVSSARAQYVIPGTVTHVEKRAFYEAINLNRLTVPASVNLIGQLAFANTSITNFTFDGNAPDSILENAFLNVPDGAQAKVSENAAGFGVGALWNGLSVDRAAAYRSPSPSTPVLAPPRVVPTQVFAKAVSLKEIVAKLLANGVPVLKGLSASKPVEFKGSSVRLDATDRAMLRTVADRFIGKRGKVILVGFVNGKGQNNTSAKKIAAIRAKNVALALISLGIDFEVGYAGFGARNKSKPTKLDNRVDFRWIAGN